MPEVSLLPFVNQVCLNKGRPVLLDLHPSMRLREDIGFDSLDMAELTVRIEEACGVDVFAEGLVKTVGEIEDILRRGSVSR